MPTSVGKSNKERLILVIFPSCI